MKFRRRGARLVCISPQTCGSIATAPVSFPLYEGGLVVKCGRALGSGRSGVAGGVSGAHISIASSWDDQAGWEARFGSATRWGPSGGQREGGACRSEVFVAGEHVPDRLGERAGEL